MKVTKFTLIVFSIFLLLFLPACLFFGRSSEDVTYIRIHNKSSQDFSYLELGGGRQNGATITPRWNRGVGAGEYSSYKSAGAAFVNYRSGVLNLDSRSNRVRLRSINPETDLGIPELKAGHYYTFEIELVDNKAVIRIVEDTAP